MTMNSQQCHNQSCQELALPWMQWFSFVLILFVVEKRRSQSAVPIGEAKNTLLRLGYTVQMVLFCNARDELFLHCHSTAVRNWLISMVHLQHHSVILVFLFLSPHTSYFVVLTSNVSGSFKGFTMSKLEKIFVWQSFFWYCQWEHWEMAFGWFWENRMLIQVSDV